jgi:hypothetical protein
MDIPNSLPFEAVILTLSEVEWGRPPLLFLSPGTYFDSALNDLGRVGHYDLYSGTGIAVS